MNLTAATISAACKYTHPSNDQTRGHLASKPGFFLSEEDRIQRVRQLVGTGKARHPLTYLIEASDDIVYSVIDVEDAVKRGVLSWRDLRRHIRNRLSREAFASLMRDTNRILLTYVGRRPIPDDISVQAMRVVALGTLIEAASEAFMERYQNIMSGTYDEELIEDGAAFRDNGLISALKKIAREVIIPHRDIVQLELMGRKVIQELMDLFWFAADRWQGHLSAEPFDRKKDAFAEKIYALISSNFRALFEHEMRHTNARRSDAAAWYQYHRALLIVDQVAGMTDTFAVTLHKELSNG